MEKVSLTHKIALGLIPGIGDINARKLVSYLGSVEAVFGESLANLRKIPGIGDSLSRYIANRNYMDRAEREAEYVESKGITTYFYLDDNYPVRLKNCDDSPVTFFFRGEGAIDAKYAISIVGTRRATNRGKDHCKKFISELAAAMPDLMIVSGLAYGIDIAAHKAALVEGLPTIGVLAHGLNTIYPSSHTIIAERMKEKGGLVTDFLSDSLPERNNFIKRNRIIAGLSDATLVVESGITGGALITADIANSYNRDVFAIPGRPEDIVSAGCNDLICRNRAALVTTASDMMLMLGWAQSRRPVQGNLFPQLEGNEKTVFELILKENEITIDDLCLATGIPVYKISTALLNMELNGIVKCRPGNIYTLA